ncbi:hypothetical protein SASPL_101848 [Salvia splendens]|uniref:Nodulin homeobox N-terminal domain-containing protein n=1 Tax=Salvia splendens TaxID=180675 RepID=A0A8X8YUR7_SALSN|nr:hypothetical protein SASPL_101848 [Salvia splendens]
MTSVILRVNLRKNQFPSAPFRLSHAGDYTPSPVRFLPKQFDAASVRSIKAILNSSQISIPPDRYCRRSTAAGTDSPLRTHSLDSLADSGLRRFGVAPSVPVALSSVPPSGWRHSRIHRAVTAVGVSLRSPAISAALSQSISSDCRGLLGLEVKSAISWLVVSGMYLGCAKVVDLEKFARNLPLHLIAVIMVWEREKSTFKYFPCGILLLHSMCDLASRVPKIEQVIGSDTVLSIIISSRWHRSIFFILLEDMKISEQLIDPVFYLLFVDMYLLLRIQESHTIPNDMVLLHAALVACSVHIQRGSICCCLCSVKYLQTNDSSRSASPTTEETLNHLRQQCDSSLQFLQPLSQQKLFRECIVNNQVFLDFTLSSD